MEKVSVLMMYYSFYVSNKQPAHSESEFEVIRKDFEVITLQKIGTFEIKSYQILRRFE